MKASRELFGRLAEAILEGGARKATKFLSPTLVVKATRRGRRRQRAGSVEILFTVGRPNYAEREYIRRARAAGEPLPVKRVLLKFDPKKK